MAQDPSQVDGTPAEIGAEDLSDEIVQKYAPERLLSMVSKKAGRGEALDASLRAKYEKKLGTDLSHVRLFSGEFAEDFNRKRDSYAVTVGASGMILMGGSPDRHLSSASGEALLAHELKHVQQSKGGLAGGLHKDSIFDGEYTQAHELEAEAFQAQTHAELLGVVKRAGMTKQEKDDAKERAKEKIRERVLEMSTDAARNAAMRGGGSRRA